MRFFKFAFLAAVSILIAGTDLLAQYTTPISFWLSPQLTAPTAMSGSDYKQISAHYQKQALAGNIGTRSMILSGQFPLYGKKNTQFGTLGVNVLRQENGSSYLFSTTGALLSYNYTVRFTSQHHLVGGAQAGYFSRRIDWNKVTTRNQFGDGYFNPGLDHGETFNDYQSRAFTTNIGLAYYLTDSRGEQRFHVGAGMINANKGRFTYLENDENQAEPVKWIVYSQFRLISNPFYELGTNMYWQQQNGFSDFVGGLQLNKGINSRKSVAEEHLGLGLYYSPDQTATMAMQLLRQNLLLGISYSLPFGSGELHNIQNAAEVTLGWRMGSKKSSYYGGSYRGNVPGFAAKRNGSAKLMNRSPAVKYKVNKKITRSFKTKASKKAAARSKKFSKKVASYKAKAKRNSPAYKNRTNGKSIFSKKSRYRKPSGPIFKTKKIKRAKPQKKRFWNRRRNVY